tara:strand:- start:4055 stop:4243 length:189 start_codon:yes stop_codon:yes gene_type:complete
MARKKKPRIYIKPSKRGSLRKALKVKKGQKIPAGKLKTKGTDSKAMKKKKVFARNARKWKKK